MRVKEKESELTQEILKIFFDYDAVTGDLIWKSKTNHQPRVKIGTVAGCSNGRGYVATKLLGEKYMNHRLVWLLHHGYLPKDKDVDHINSVRNDNRIENLQLVTRKENAQRSLKRKSSSSKFIGVCWKKENQKWQAAYSDEEGVKHYIGLYNDEVEAALIAEAKQREVKGAFFNEKTSVESVLAGDRTSGLLTTKKE